MTIVTHRMNRPPPEGLAMIEENWDEWYCPICGYRYRYEGSPPRKIILNPNTDPNITHSVDYGADPSNAVVSL